MTEYRPDSWLLYKVTYTDRDVRRTEIRVLAGWSGGYTTGDSWRINSGVTDIEYDGDYIIFRGMSGSSYVVHKDANRLSMAMAPGLDALQRLTEECKEVSLAEAEKIVQQ